MSLITTITLKLLCNLEESGDLSTARDNLFLDRPIALADGDGADEANIDFHDKGSLAFDTPVILDLYESGVLLDPFKRPLKMETLKCLFIHNKSKTDSLLIGGGSDPIGIFENASSILILPPSGTVPSIFLFSAPIGLDIKTNKNLKLEHGGPGELPLEYEIVIVGVD